MMLEIYRIFKDLRQEIEEFTSASAVSAADGEGLKESRSILGNDESLVTKKKKGAARPYTLLTFAQSLDGFISNAPGKPLALSCKESLLLTHALRHTFQGILIGIGTVLADDPSLSTRYLDKEVGELIPKYSEVREDDNGLREDVNSFKELFDDMKKEFSNLNQPRPIIVDARLETPPFTSKFMARRPILITCTPHLAKKEGMVVDELKGNDILSAYEERKKILEKEGAVILNVPSIIPFTEPSPFKHSIDLELAFKLLYTEHGIKSVMVEGGSRIIQSFLKGRSRGNEEEEEREGEGAGTKGDIAVDHQIDKLVVTVCPLFLGEGVHALMGSDNNQTTTSGRITLPKLEAVTWTNLGRDAILIATP